MQVEGETPDEKAGLVWGRPVEGVQVRLRADKYTWEAEEKPIFKADIRNRGELELYVHAADEFCQLEIDGQWYGWSGPWGKPNVKSLLLAPGSQINDISISLAKKWIGKRNELTLTSGMHTVRVAFVFQRAERKYQDVVRAVSNPIEIAILPGKTNAQVEVVGQAGALAEKRKVYLPDLETPHTEVVLDLATGQMLSAEGMEKDHQYFEKLGKGDIVYEYASGEASLLCLRGAKMRLLTNDGPVSLEPDVQRQYFVVYVLKDVPCQYQVTTAEGDKYELKVLSVDEAETGGAHIEYWKAGAQVEVEDEQPETSSSRAWYMLRQWNVGPLLLGLTQRLGKVINSSQRDDRVWTGVDDGGRLELDIAVESDTIGEIFVGFFRDPTWSAEPVQVRSFPSAGQYIVENLPPGNFQIGAMIGLPPVAAALGVQRMWPEPVAVERGKTTAAQVLLSPDFQKHASGWYNREVSGDYMGNWDDVDPGNLLQGRVAGPASRPIPFAEILIREYNPGARGIMAPNRGANELGFYKYDGMKWPYRVSARWRQSLPSAFGYRYQHLFLNRVLEGPQTVDFSFEPFPEASATLVGKVSDQHGNPLQEFFLAVRTWLELNEMWENPDGKYHNMVGYRIPFISQDGTFRLERLPEGVFFVRAVPFKIQAYVLDRGQQVTLQPGKITNVDIQVTAKNIFYGRVLFEDGSPAVIKPAPWPEAKTSIIMPMGGGRARGVATVGEDGYFALHLNQREIEQLRSGESRLIINVPTAEKGRRKSMGEFNFELLAEQRDKAGSVKIKRPRTDVPVEVEKP